MSERATKKKLYVGCGLTLAPESFRGNVERLKASLEADWDVLKFLGLGAAYPGDVYYKDIVVNVGGCDAFLAVCDEPSLGLGWEMREAIGLQKPVLAVAHLGSKVTRLVTDAPLFNPNFELKTYENMVRDVPPLVSEHFATVLND